MYRHFPDSPVGKEHPEIKVKGGFLKSFEHNVAVIRALGFHLQLTISSPPPTTAQGPLTVLVENIRGHEVRVQHRPGTLQHLMRSKSSVIFELCGNGDHTITLDEPSEPEEFDFLFFGDMHGMFHHLEEILDTANATNPRFIMSNGDVTHSGRLSDYHMFSDLISASDVPVFTSIGNHDKRARGGRMTYRKMFAPLYYAFEVGNARFIVLDSSRKRGLQKFQYRWLERQLQLAKHKRIFVFLHRPPVCPKYNYLSFSATSNARRFLKMMEKYKVEMVFGSHVHVFTQFTKRNVPYVVTGGGGGALWHPSNIHHYLRVFVKKDGVDLRLCPLPTPEAKMSQRLKDAFKFNWDYHVAKNKRLRQFAFLQTMLLLTRTSVEEKHRLPWRKR